MVLSERDILEMSHYGIPERMQGGLIRYFNNRIQPGSFLTAVLSNDLIGAIGRADDENIDLLKAYAMWLYNVPPGRPIAWGSPEAVEAWLTEEAA